MNAKDCRNAWLKKLLEDSGLSATAFAKQYGIRQGHISQLLNGIRSLGAPLARKLEPQFGLEPGIMDRAMPGQTVVIVKGSEIAVSARAGVVAQGYDEVSEVRKRIIDQLLDDWLHNEKSGTAPPKRKEARPNEERRPD